MRVLALVILAGCGFQPVSAVGDDDAGPHGDGAVDGNANHDTDGDGIDDSVDNCPTVANPDQHDFDGDHHGDACDHCPHLASVDDPDTDGDGVGDACDPRPGMMDQRVYWTGFYDPDEIAAWTHTGTWAVTGGVLLQSTNMPPPVAIELPITVTRAYVATSATPITEGSSGVPAIGVEVKGTHEYGCGVYVTSNTAGVAETDLTMTDAATWTEPFPGTAIGLVMNEVTTNACTIEEDGTLLGLSTTQGLTTSGKVQLTSEAVTASFAYLFVVETSP